MSTPVNLPALGESVTEGTVTRWLKQVGDTVEVDEPLLEVSTDKVDTEIPSPVAGTLIEIKAEEDETVEVGAELCVIGDEGEGGGSDDADGVRRLRRGRRARGVRRGRGRGRRRVRARRVRRGRGRRRGGGVRGREPEETEMKPAAKKSAAAAAPRSRCRRSVSRSPRAPSPGG